MNLYLIPTPIGNTADITKRAVDLLKGLNVIICEDTRVTKNLLRLLEIDYSEKQFISFFEGNEVRKLNQVIDILQESDAGLVSDSGTPLISDPGFKLIREIRQNYSDQIKITALPGATSITTALINSGLPTDKFTFIGFLPPKSGKKKTLFTKLIEINNILKITFVAFESPHRIEKTLKVMDEIYSENAEIVVCRELTKKFESIYSGKAIELLEQIRNHKLKVKGEFVIVFSILSD